jgi:hypothetical protein
VFAGHVGGADDADAVLVGGGAAEEQGEFVDAVGDFVGDAGVDRVAGVEVATADVAVGCNGNVVLLADRLTAASRLGNAHARPRSFAAAAVRSRVARASPLQRE